MCGRPSSATSWPPTWPGHSCPTPAPGGHPRRSFSPSPLTSHPGRSIKDLVLKGTQILGVRIVLHSHALLRPAMRRSRKVAVTAVMGLAVSVVADLLREWRRRRAAPDWFPRYSGEVSGDDALLSGTLELEGRCLYVTGGHGQRTLPIFPRDSSFSPGTGKLVVLGWTFHVGQQFKSGGEGAQPRTA